MIESFGLGKSVGVEMILFRVAKTFLIVMGLSLAFAILSFACRNKDYKHLLIGLGNKWG